MKFVAVLFLLVSCYNSMAQSTVGITNQPDTSFTTYSAYTKAVKKYPAIQIVNEFQLTGVTEKKDIVYCKAGQRELMLDVHP